MPFIVTLHYLYNKPGFDELGNCPCGGVMIEKQNHKTGGLFAACSNMYCYNTERKMVTIARDFRKLFAWEECLDIIGEIEIGDSTLDNPASDDLEM